MPITLQGSIRVVPVVTLVMTVVALGACEEANLPGDPAAEVAELVVAPENPMVDPGDTVQFQAYGLTSDGDSVAVEVTWGATAGTISESGRYVADSTVHDGLVRATLTGRDLERTEIGRAHV